MSVRLRVKGASEDRSENGRGRDTSVKSEGDLYGKHSDSRRESGHCCWWYVPTNLPVWRDIVCILVHSNIMCTKRRR